jgi:acylphosphatase
MTVRDLAVPRGIAGWVCNVSDGTVAMEAQAEMDNLKGFLEEIGQVMSRNITDCQVRWLKADANADVGLSAGDQAEPVLPNPLVIAGDKLAR